MKKHKPNLIDTANLLYDRISVNYQEYGSHWGLSDMTLKILNLLYNDQAHTQTQIRDLTDAPKQTINNIVKSLHKNGYISVTPSETNGREKIVELTESGLEYTEMICEDLHNMKEQVALKMGTQKLTLLVDLLSEYNRELSENMQSFLKNDRSTHISE